MVYDEVEHQRLKQDKIESAIRELEKIIREVCK